MELTAMLSTKANEQAGPFFLKEETSNPYIIDNLTLTITLPDWSKVSGNKLYYRWRYWLEYRIIGKTAWNAMEIPVTINNSDGFSAVEFNIPANSYNPNSETMEATYNLYRIITVNWTSKIHFNSLPNEGFELRVVAQPNGGDQNGKDQNPISCIAKWGSDAGTTAETCTHISKVALPFLSHTDPAEAAPRELDINNAGKNATEIVIQQNSYQASFSPEQFYITAITPKSCNTTTVENQVVELAAAQVASLFIITDKDSPKENIILKIDNKTEKDIVIDIDLKYGKTLLDGQSSDLDLVVTYGYELFYGNIYGENRPTLIVTAQPLELPTIIYSFGQYPAWMASATIGRQGNTGGHEPI